MAVPCWDPAHGNPPRLNLSLLSLQIPYSSSSPGTYVVSPPAPAVCPFVRSSCGLGGNQCHGRWELGEVFENRERWAVLMFAHPTLALSPQGPPGGGGPPGTPIMPSPAGMSPLRPPLSPGQPSQAPTPSHTRRPQSWDCAAEHRRSLPYW